MAMHGIDRVTVSPLAICFITSTYALLLLVPVFGQPLPGSRYDLVGAKETDAGLSGTLVSRSTIAPALGLDLAYLKLDVAKAVDTIQIKITDPSASRWEVPRDLYSTRQLTGEGRAAEAQLHVQHCESPFSLDVSRKDSQDTEPLLNTSGYNFIFKEQYLELTSAVPPTSILYGLGERTQSAGLSLQRGKEPITLWNRDQPSLAPDQNLYGSHPFIMEVRPDGSAHGVLLFSSNGMDVVLSQDAVQWRVTGGIIEMYIFAGPTPALVMQQMTAVIGRPQVPPYWSLGFHQCKYGYKSIWEVEQVVENYTAANIPLEAMWTDIDYMSGFRDFTFDESTFPQKEVQAWVQKLHASNRSWVPIVDPGIKVDPSYKPYTDGLAADIFVKDAAGKPYLGKVWPGETHWPDFMNPKAEIYWQQQLQAFHDLAAFDGLWIDMNEVSNFVSGSAANSGSSVQANRSQLEHPPYKINNGNQHLPLSFQTMPVTAVGYNGTLQYNAHNMYGLYESAVTSRVLKAVTGKRPFALTRSTFLGSGQYASHWQGDNAATWNDLRWSVTSMLSSGLHGIPHNGADICGFQEETTEELCNRWILLGAFYPFSRDHSAIRAGYQELYRWPSVAAAGRKALHLRYKLLPYLYTAFHTAHETGDPVARPLFYHWPQDRDAHSADGQFLLGDSILVTPVLQQGADSVTGYFPRGAWHALWNGSTDVDASKGGRHVALSTPLGESNVHVRAGSIVPLQRPALTTAAVRASPVALLVALPSSLQELAAGFTQQQQQAGGFMQRRLQADLAGSSHAEGVRVATGSMVVDDGASLQEDWHVLSFDAYVAEGVNGLQGTLHVHGPASEGSGGCSGVQHVLGSIEVKGWPASVGRITLKAASGQEIADHWQHGQITQEGHALLIERLHMNMLCSTDIRIHWSSRAAAEAGNT